MKVSLLLSVVGAFVIGGSLVCATDISPGRKAGTVLGVGLGFLVGALRRVG